MKLAKLIVTFFYMGQAKIAPGSLASLAITLLFYTMAKNLIFTIFIIFILAITILSFFAIQFYTTEFIEKDRSEIVIDEVVGQSIALLPLLLFSVTEPPEIYMCLISFIFFRFFDIVKPYPIYIFDNMNNTFGIIFDDILAGMFSAILLTLVLII